LTSARTYVIDGAGTAFGMTYPPPRLVPSLSPDKPMPTTPLLNTTVHPDWEELTRQRALRQARYWTALQLGLVFSTLLAVLIKLVYPAWGWHGLVWEAFFVPLAWLVPLITIYRWAPRDRSESLRRTLTAAGVIVAAMILVLIGAHQLFAPGVKIGEPSLPPALAVAVPLMTWPVLGWTYRRFPLASRQMGLMPDRWLVNLIMGAAAGAAMGLGLVLATGWKGHFDLSGLRAPGAFAWLLAYEAGLRAPGEEMLFRGLAYRMMVGDPNARLAQGITRVVLLNLLAYVVPVVSATTIEGRLGILVYGAALAVTSTLLRYRQHSLLPGMAANVVFSVILVGYVR
jgi:hypothetical protein